MWSIIIPNPPLAPTRNEKARKAKSVNTKNIGRKNAVKKKQLSTKKATPDLPLLDRTCDLAWPLRFFKPFLLHQPHRHHHHHLPFPPVIVSISVLIALRTYLNSYHLKSRSTPKNGSHISTVEIWNQNQLSHAQWEHPESICYGFGSGGIISSYF